MVRQHQRVVAAMLVVAASCAASCQSLLEFGPERDLASVDASVDGATQGTPDAASDGSADAGADARPLADAAPPTFCDGFAGALLCADFDDDRFFAAFDRQSAPLPQGLAVEGPGVSGPRWLRMALNQQAFLDKTVSTSEPALRVDLDVRCDLPEAGATIYGTTASVTFGSFSVYVVTHRFAVSDVPSMYVALYRSVQVASTPAVDSPSGTVVHLGFVVYSEGKVQPLDDAGMPVGTAVSAPPPPDEDASAPTTVSRLMLGTNNPGQPITCFIDNLVVRRP